MSTISPTCTQIFNDLQAGWRPVENGNLIRSYRYKTIIRVEQRLRKTRRPRRLMTDSGGHAPSCRELLFTRITKLDTHAQPRGSQVPAPPLTDGFESHRTQESTPSRPEN
ncbi:hypothetical protein CBL_14051 [Carabus blaptoides fortunei]